MTSTVAITYGGYEYQLVVSVWLALDLIVARAWCAAIEIEPASQEDIAVDLQVEPDSASSKVSVFPEPGPVEIQIKTRSGIWSLAALRALLETPEKRGASGPDPRPRALDRLMANPSLRYVLVTNAQVAGDARQFLVESIGGRSDGAANAALRHDDALRRIGLLEQKVPPLVEHEIDGLLELSARVPLQRVTACRATLIEAVRLRLLGRRPPMFDRAELAEIITAHGGMPSSGRDDFVEPASFPDLARRLEEPPFALILIGPPGIGKTVGAERLVDEHRRAARPFEVLKDPSVSTIRRALSRGGRTLFYLEDPWGNYRRRDEGDAWTDELPRLIREANNNPDKRFLITSRTGVLAESINLNPAGDTDRVARQLGAYVGKLSEADFDVKRRSEILRRRMRGAERWQRDWVDDVAADVVARLTVPHALATFAQRVQMTPAGTELDLDMLVSESQIDAIAGTVARQARAVNAIESTVVLWVFFGTMEAITPEFSRDVSSWLQSEVHVAIDVPRLVSYLEPNGWVTIRDGQFTAHPTVVEGLERIVDAERVTTDRILTALLSTLVAHGHVDRVARIVRRLQRRTLPISAPVRTAIDEHLRAAVLTADDVGFRSAAEMLVDLSNACDAMSLLVRAVAATGRRHGFPSWTSPIWTESEITLVRGSSDAEAVTRRWIRLAAREDRHLGNEQSLVQFLGSLGWDLTEDFTVAAIDAIDRGSMSGIALRGALAASEPQFDRLLEAALRNLAEVEKWFEDEGHPKQRRAEECELDAGYSAHVLDEPGERFYAPSNAIESIVRVRRDREGYGWLTAHPRRSLLLDAWAIAIPFDVGDAAHDELLALLAAAEGRSRPKAWEAVGRARCHALTHMVLHVLVNGPSEELTSVWSALFGLYAPGELAEIVGPTVRALDWPLRAAALFEAKDADIPDRGDHVYRDPKAHRAAVLRLLNPGERAAFDACFASASKDPEYPPLAEASAMALGRLTEASNDRLVSLAVVALAHYGRSVPDTFDRLIASSDEWVRLHSLRAAAAIEPFDRTFIRRGLSDSYYQCRRLAMYVLAADASPEERTAIVSMAADHSAPIREACANVIGQYHWTEGLTALCELLGDRRDRNQATLMTDAIPDYHVARAAARALRQFPAPLPTEAFQRILRFVDTGPGAGDDLVVHATLVSVLAQHRDATLPPLIQPFLRSGRRAGGTSGTFPLRYAAAWGWFEHLLKYSEDATAIPSTVLARCATHSDARLAAPALMSLGVISAHAGTDIDDVLGDSGTTAERALLIEAGARIAAGPLAAALLNRALPATHPGRRLLAWCWDTAEEAERWKVRLDADSEIQHWLDSIRKRHPINAALRTSLLSSPRASLLNNISTADFRRDELPKEMPIITTFHFAGLE